MKKKWYMVYKVKVPEVYDGWDDYLEQVNEFSDNSYQRYKSKEEAKAR
jgi:viroplasmin and RNaseH domain-containing protein